MTCNVCNEEVDKCKQINHRTEYDRINENQKVEIVIDCKAENTEKIMDFLKTIEFPMECDRIVTKVDGDTRF